MLKKYFVDLSLIFVAVVWALNFSIIKVTLKEIDPFSFNALRFIFAALLIYTVARKRGHNLTVRKEDFWKMIGIGIIGNLFYQLFFIVGVNLTLSANAAVMIGTIPIWVAILSQFFTDEKLSGLKLLGVISAFIGVILIIVAGKNPVSLSSDTFLGNIITLVSALCWAVFTILSRKYLRIYSPLKYSAFMSVVGVISLTLVGLPFMIKLDWSGVSIIGWSGVLYSGILSVGLAYIIWNNGVKKIGAVRTATYQNLVPVLGLLFGLVLLGEELTIFQYIGASFVIAGIVMARFQRKPTLLPTS